MAAFSEPDAMSMPASVPSQPEYAARLGPLAPLVANSQVTEVMVVAGRDVYVEVNGRLMLTPITFSSEQEVLDVITFIVESVGRRIDAQNPICDARLQDGSRVHAAIRPVAIDGPLLNIRKFVRGPLNMDDLMRLGSCSESAFGFLKACVMARANILVSGGTSSGKTTLLNVMSGYIPSDERIVTIEDAAELQLQQRHVARLESRPSSPDGTPEVNLRDLVISSLRMRPDRLIVGEVRGPEALDMLQAMNTGHDGSMTTLHANKPRDALARIETLVMMAGYDLVPRAIRSQIASAFNVVVHLERMRDGSRKVVKISEITGMDDDVISMQDIFQFTRTGLDPEGRVLGGFAPASIRPRILDRLADRGLETPLELARIFPQANRQPQ
jgi:pilus assembly protein CpaF